MQKLCKNYAKITQKKLRKNYAYVCKLHNLHYYAPPTLLMLPTAPGAAHGHCQGVFKFEHRDKSCSACSQAACSEHV